MTLRFLVLLMSLLHPLCFLGAVKVWCSMDYTQPATAGSSFLWMMSPWGHPTPSVLNVVYTDTCLCLFELYLYVKRHGIGITVFWYINIAASILKRKLLQLIKQSKPKGTIELMKHQCMKPKREHLAWHAVSLRWLRAHSHYRRGAVALSHIVTGVCWLTSWLLKGFICLIAELLGWYSSSQNFQAMTYSSLESNVFQRKYLQWKTLFHTGMWATVNYIF